MTTDPKTDTTEATTAPGTPAAVDAAAQPAAAQAVEVVPPRPPRPVAPSDAAGVERFTSSAEVIEFLRQLRADVDAIRADLTACQADVNEMGNAIGDHAGVLDAQSKTMDTIQGVITGLVQTATAPRIRTEAARTLPPGGALPGGVVLPPLQAAPPASAVPGLAPLPPVRSAPSILPPLAPAASAPAPGQPGWTPKPMEVAINVDGLAEGTHVIPGDEATGRPEVEVRVKRPGLGIGGAAAPRNPSPAFRRSR